MGTGEVLTKKRHFLLLFKKKLLIFDIFSKHTIATILLKKKLLFWYKFSKFIKRTEIHMWMYVKQSKKIIIPYLYCIVTLDRKFSVKNWLHLVVVVERLK